MNEFRRPSRVGSSAPHGHPARRRPEQSRPARSRPAPSRPAPSRPAPSRPARSRPGAGRRGPALALSGALFAASCGGQVPNDLAADLGAAYGELAAGAEARAVVAVAGREGWFFSVPELRHLAGGALDAFDPLAVILGLDRELAARGVDLLVVPVPPKAIIYADKVGVEDPVVPIPVPRLDPNHRAFYGLLRSEGVDVLDLTERFLDDRFHGEGPLYCRQDTHWSGVGCVVAAQAIAEVVRERPWFSALDTRPYRFGWQSTTIDGDLARHQRAPPAREELRLRTVAAAGEGRPAAVPSAPDSPITLLGDTHALVFHAGEEMHAVGSGLADQLVYELGLPLDVVASETPGSALADLRRRAQADPASWDGKRLVIWCFAARAFTAEGAWRVSPNDG